MARITGVQKSLLKKKHGGLFKLEKKLQQELDDVLQQEELYWHQKSRKEWIISSDRNTRFYHTATVIRRNLNRVKGLKNEHDVLITDKQSLKKMMVRYFSDLFKRYTSCDLSTALKGNFPTLSDATIDVISKDFIETDVKNAVMEMAPLKAPGPDGLHVVFYQKMWNIIGKSVFKMTKDFFDTSKLTEGMNDTIITLIPKTENPERLVNFRPISLCNVSYKIITKTMTNRLKEVMKEVVGPNQSSFVLCRQISDNIIIYQEVLNTMRRKRKGKGLMVFKIDLENAYDRLSWDFIKDTLTEVGMGETWTRNIMSCVETARLSIL